MDMTPSLIISFQDMEKITALLPLASASIADLLAEELHRAKLLPSDEMPNSVVRMNSEVDYMDLETGQSRRLQIVYPQDADMARGKVSILAPIGAALIGLSAGQEIHWPVSSKKTKKIKVISVLNPD